MASFFCKLEALHTFNAANTFGCAVDGGAVKNITDGDYFWKSIADGGSTTLAARFQSLIQAAPNAIPAATVTIDPATGAMTIAWNGGNHSLIFAGASQARCGFAGSIANGPGPNVGTKQVKGLWLPTVAPTGLRSSVASAGALVTDRRVIKSAAHSVSKVTFNSWHEQTYRFVGLTKAKGYIADEATANESFEQFFTDCLNVGAPFRFYKDRTDDATYRTWDDELPKGLGGMAALKPNQDGNWNLEIPATEYIHVDTGRGF